MSSELVPKVVFSFKEEKDDLTHALEDFCTRGLLIPGEFLEHYARHPDMDSFYIHTRNGLRFLVSGPEIRQWEYRRGIKRPCGPSRDDDIL